MTNKKNGLLPLLASFTVAATMLLSAPAQAGGGISIPLPPLPPIPHIKFSAPPLMVWLPTPAVHVALDSPYPIFHHENRYYLHSNNVWYAGPGYQGPWASVHVNLLPAGLHHYHNHGWHYYQHQARYWQHHHHRAHPHFYGHRRNEHHEDRSSMSHRDKQPPRYEPRNHYDSHAKPNHQPPAHHKSRDHSRNEHREPAHSPGRAQFNNHARGHEMTRAKVHGNDRGHGNKHWRGSY